MKPASFLALFAALMVAGCQPRPTFQVEQSRSYALSKETAWSNVLAFLKASDITVVRSDPASGVIQASRTGYQDAGWAYCEPARVTDSTSESVRGPIRTRIWLDRNLALEIQVRDAGDMVQVTVDAHFSERQINPYKNLPFDVPCQSKGVLEKALLDAV